ncbi:MAG: hypothetical protein H6825_09295 [Planctomycetes bacterium]|nr:hypothetical protein [Planctomycetota bacterium]
MDHPTQARGLADDPALAARLADLCREGRRLAARFERDVRSQGFHPFKPADYEDVLDALVGLRRPGLRFLEWGSATGVITIMADMLGMDAAGIELDADLVDDARALATRHGSHASFVAGSFLPTGYTWTSPDGESHLGTLGEGTSAYAALGHDLDAYDVVYAYPWIGEEPVMRDVMARHGKRDARLLLHAWTAGVDVHRVDATTH